MMQALGLAGGNMEGKEVRFGIANSALFTTITTDASCGAVNNMHDSLTPLGGLVVGYLYLKGGRMTLVGELKYRAAKWRINRTRRKFDVYAGGRSGTGDRRIH